MRLRERTKMSKKKLDFRIDEYVVYPAHGVGKVTAVDEQEVAGIITLELFVVAFDKDKMTLRVPTHKAIEVGMRPLASPDVVAHCHGDPTRKSQGETGYVVAPRAGI